MKTRRRFTAEFKAKVALEAIRGERTISEPFHETPASPEPDHAVETASRREPGQGARRQGFRCAGRPGSRGDEAARQDRSARRRAGFFGQGLRSLSLDRRRMMIDPDHERLSIRRQCELVSISRASFYRQPAGESPENLELMRIIDEAFMEMPWYGSRQMARHLRRQGWCVGRKRVRRLMRKIGLSPIYQAPKTSEPHPQHRIYPYLLRHLAIERPNQVWCADVTYIPMRRGFLYLVAIMDWFSRKVLSWRLSNTMEADFCVAALEEAIARHGRPDIFNTDQGSQFTSFAFTTTLKDAGIRISMDGRGRWMDNVFIERLWRSLKYECVFLNAFETGSEARAGIGSWIDYYNRRRPHSTFGGRTPDEVYDKQEMTEQLAA
ncbi:putative transposase [Falsochrobactrum ovis]|uniref:Putative transposase n=1 Tax=Falsochrobactrum ovis TaxID=1293442 RepID=A0A364JSK6_9HYPH|nr:putative transposase [Falsochrobactrum ovis]